MRGTIRDGPRYSSLSNLRLAWKKSDGKNGESNRTVLGGTADANIAFKDLCSLLKRLGFAERIRGDHFIFTKFDIEEILNLQPLGSKAKAYQVKQVRGVILKYKLGEPDVS